MFRVGQKVVCIVHWPLDIRRPDAVYAEKDCVYTIRGFCPGTDGQTRLYLSGIHNKPMISVANGLMEFGFNAKYFRPLVERKTSIEIFTKMLTPTGKENVHV
jgi:hypothetical protein